MFTAQERTGRNPRLNNRNRGSTTVEPLDRMPRSLQTSEDARSQQSRMTKQKVIMRLQMRLTEEFGKQNYSLISDELDKCFKKGTKLDA